MLNPPSAGRPPVRVLGCPRVGSCQTCRPRNRRFYELYEPTGAPQAAWMRRQRGPRAGRRPFTGFNVLSSEYDRDPRPPALACPPRVP